MIRRRWVLCGLAALMLVVAALAGLRLHQQARIEEQVTHALTAEERLAASLRNLTERLEEPRFSALLSPEFLGTAGGLDVVRKALERHRQIVAARQALLRRHEQVCRALAAALPAGQAGSAAAAALLQRAETAERMYRRVDEWQRERARRVEVALDWYAVNGASVAVGDTRAAAPTRSGAEARRLRNDVVAAEAEIRLVLQAVNRLEGARRAAASATR